MSVAYPHKSSLSVAPSVEPVDASTLTDIKLHLAISDTTWDAKLPVEIKSARQWMEGKLGRALITQTWICTMDEWADVIYLPKAPLQSVTSIYYKNSEGTSTLLAPSNYNVVTKSDPGEIRRAHGVSYPTLQSGTPDVITITFVAGYGNAGTDVPSDIVDGIRIKVGDLFSRRDSMLMSNVRHDDSFINDLVHRYKLYRF